MKRAALILTLALAATLAAPHVQSAAGLTFEKHEIVSNLAFSPWADYGSQAALVARPTAGSGDMDMAITPRGDSRAARLYVFYDPLYGPGSNGAWRNLIIESGGGPGGEGFYILSETTNTALNPPPPIRIGSSNFASGAIRDLLIIVPSLTDGQDGGVKMGSQALYGDWQEKELRGLPQVPNAGGLCGTDPRITRCIPLRAANSGVVWGYMPAWSAP